MKSRFVPDLDGAVDLTEAGGMVRSRTFGHWFIERDGRTDDAIVDDALRLAEECGPMPKQD